MKREPLKHHREPEYPEREQAPEAARRFVPARWRTNGAVAGAAALLALPVEGMAAEKPQARATKVEIPQPPPEHDPADSDPPLVAGKVSIAPVIPPEDEARRIIREEFAAVGVEFRADLKEVPGVFERGRFPVTHAADRRSPEMSLRTATLDGWSDKHALGFEFVGHGDRPALDRHVEDGKAHQRHWGLDDLVDLFLRRSAASGLRVAVFVDASDGMLPDGNSICLAPEDPLSCARVATTPDSLRARVREFIALLRERKLLPPEATKR